jgi:hypothetical protein
MRYVQGEGAVAAATTLPCRRKSELLTCCGCVDVASSDAIQQPQHSWEVDRPGLAAAIRHAREHRLIEAVPVELQDMRDVAAAHAAGSLLSSGLSALRMVTAGADSSVHN